MTTKPTVVIHMGGGLIEYIECDGPVNVIVVNTDVEGVEQDRIKQTIFGAEATIDAHACEDLSRERTAQWSALASI